MRLLRRSMCAVSRTKPPAYEPHQVDEAAWRARWREVVALRRGDRSREPFSMVLPPPNVTGNLHIGHALNVAIQDFISRAEMKKGKKVYWTPGFDHAGIATQLAVERSSGLSALTCGREHFVAKCQEWSETRRNTIARQLEALGPLLDWDNSVYTLDETHSRTVTEAFCRLHEMGLLYRAEAFVNWSPFLQSTISDMEVEQEVLTGPTAIKVPGFDDKVNFGEMTTFAYKLEDSSGELAVATTRLETMLADTAVAIHPEDPRYSHLVGRYLVHPFVPDRRIPVLADEQVDRDLGTGAVKITPAHSEVDHEIASRHSGIASVDLFTPSGHVRPEFGDGFAGLHRFRARRVIADRLRHAGLFRGVSDHPMTLRRCARSLDVLEPTLKRQWFVRTSELAARSLRSLEQGELVIQPPHHEAVWHEFLGQSRDWCISRQLSWGHRVPAWRPEGAETRDSVWTVATEEAAARQLRPQQQLEQDGDVLDTWFSSALYPLTATAKTGAATYPLSLMETGSDILFFWVARMHMLCTALTETPPFSKVLLHGIVRDSRNRKMSKSLGNIVDPLHLIEGASEDTLRQQIKGSGLSEKEKSIALRSAKPIEAAGPDAVRLSLLSYNWQSDVLTFDPTLLRNDRTFCNKLWQAGRFVSMSLPPNFSPAASSIKRQGALDTYLLSALASCQQKCEENYSSHRLHRVIAETRHFLLHHLCDFYMEAVKPQFKCETASASTFQILWHAYTTVLHLLHPAMPFLTEHLWAQMHESAGLQAPESLLALTTPQTAANWSSQTALDRMEQVRYLIAEMSSLRVVLAETKSLHFEVVIREPWLEDYRDILNAFAAVTVVSEPSSSSGRVSSQNAYSLYLDAASMRDHQRSVDQLHRRLHKLHKQLEKYPERGADIMSQMSVLQDLQALLEVLGSGPSQRRTSR